MTLLQGEISQVLTSEHVGSSFTLAECYIIPFCFIDLLIIYSLCFLYADEISYFGVHSIKCAR